MRNVIIQFQGDYWDDQEEAEKIESAVQKALDKASIDYVDLHVQ
jgi:diketogulonate reductase-like aldo/keto reductase